MTMLKYYNDTALSLRESKANVAIYYILDYYDPVGSRNGTAKYCDIVQSCHCERSVAIYYTIETLLFYPISRVPVSGDRGYEI